MSNIEKVKEYIEYFKNKNNDFYQYKKISGRNGIIYTTNIAYSNKVEEFIDFFYKSEFIDYDYLNNIERYCKESNKIYELIEFADINLLKSILTYYIRQERFCDGMIATAIDNNVFENILQRVVIYLS